PSFKQSWIPVGEHDITSDISNGFRSLSLSKEFKDKLCKPWANTLVVRLLGKSIGYSYLCHRLHSMWKPASPIHIIDLDKGCFMVKFGAKQDYFKALTGGPWMILDHYLVVHQWSPDFRVSDSLPAKMVVWVRFPFMPVQYYHVQDVEYEHLPALCFTCGKVGHLLVDCPSTRPSHPPTAVGVPHQPSGSSGSPIWPSLPSPDNFGPWMVVTRKSRRPRKESDPGKESVILGKEDPQSATNGKGKKDDSAKSSADRKGKKVDPSKVAGVGNGKRRKPLTW
ncbi:hypothetical protein LINPERHAP1_LOCUS17718, partial [Linum perenne]